MKMQGKLSDDEIGQMTGALAMDRYGVMNAESQKSLSVALTDISQHPINYEAICI
jgi:hypothetical protein